MALVRFQSVEKTFGTVRAVDGVSFDIDDGEFVCLLGPSGCGKTTTLRLIAGLEKPTAGSIHIGDRDVTQLPARDRDIGMVFQDYALYPHMTIAENIGYPLKVRNAPVAARDARVREVAEHLQIGNLLERRPGQISGGQQQRTSVARAVVHEPQVFLFDEPLSNLDAKLRLEARSFLEAPPAGGGRHRRVRDARPGRGDGDRRPHRGDERGTHRADGAAARGLPAALPPPSSRTSSAALP